MTSHLHTRISCIAAVALGAAVAPQAASAQGEWAMLEFAAHRYDAIVNSDPDVGLPCCAPHVMTMDGAGLLRISGVIDAPWSEDLDRVSVYSRDLTLVVEGEEPLTPIGEYDRYGVFELGAPSVYVSRPRNWPDEDKHLYFDIVYRAPAGAGRATFNLGEFVAHEFEIPPQTSAPPRPIDTVSVNVVGAEFVDAAPSQGGAVAAITGAVLKVDFQVTIEASNAVDGDGDYLYHTGDFQLVGPDGLPTLALGQLLVDSLTRDTTNSFNGDIIGKSYDQTLYFLAGGDAGTYTLFYGADAAAEFALP